MSLSFPFLTINIRLPLSFQESLQRRMKNLEATGLSLQAELKAAKEKLLEKELEISKERLRTVDSQLTLNRQVQKLEKKLTDNDVQVKSLDKELAKTRVESEALKKALEEARNGSKISAPKEIVVEEKLKSISQNEEPVPECTEENVTDENLPLVPEAEASLPSLGHKVFEGKVAIEEPHSSTEKEDIPVKQQPSTTRLEESVHVAYKNAADGKNVFEGLTPTTEKEELVHASERKTTVTTEKAIYRTTVQQTPVKKTGTKRASSTKETASKTKGVVKSTVEIPTVFFAERLPPQPPTRTMASTENTTAKDSPVKVDANDWTSLSKSTISRKTVKELSEYLDSKGVATTGSDGKTLKKAELIEAVMSL
jgi:hypothetical protein